MSATTTPPTALTDAEKVEARAANKKKFEAAFAELAGQPQERPNAAGTEPTPPPAPEAVPPGPDTPAAAGDGSPKQHRAAPLMEKLARKNAQKEAARARGAVAVRYSIFGRARDNMPTTREAASFLDLARELEDEPPKVVGPTQENKKSSPMISPAEFKKGATRGNNNVVAVHFALLDFDGLTEDQKTEVLAVAEPFESFFYTTHGHHEAQKQGRWKFRLGFALSRPVLASEWPKFFTALRRKFLDLPDEACAGPSRCYFAPALPSEEARSTFVFEVGEGDPLDVDLLLAQVPAETARESTKRHAADQKSRMITAADLEWLARRLLGTSSDAKKKVGGVIMAVARQEPFAEAGERDDMMFRSVSDILDNWPAADEGSIRELFRPSIEKMLALDKDAPDMDVLDSKVRRAKDKAQEKKDAEAAHIAELIAKAKDDKSCVLEDDAVEALAELRTRSRADYDRTRRQLKDIGCSVTSLDARIKDLADLSDEDDEDELSQAEKLKAIILSDEVELFHDPKGEAFCRVRVPNEASDKKSQVDDGPMTQKGANDANDAKSVGLDHAENMGVASSAMRRWLTHRYLDIHDGAASMEALRICVNLAESVATYRGREREVYTRVAPGPEGTVFIDLGDRQWTVICVIASSEWKVLPEAPVFFRRSSGTRPLPIPVRGGSLDELRQFVNCPDPESWALLKAWLVQVIYPFGPYPHLALTGGQGRAKTSMARRCVAITDPAEPELRSPPRNEDDLVIAAKGRHLPAFDNTSDLTPWFSDAACRLATGGGLGKRQLYSDDEEVLFSHKRPLLLNGIGEFIAEDDLLDRTIILSLPEIPEGARKEERELDPAFEEARPRIFGALLDRLAGALGELPNVKLTCRPRMADFARLAVAAERAAGEKPMFLQAYTGMRRDSHRVAIDASPIGGALLTFIYKEALAEKSEWKGTSRQLLDRLAWHAGNGVHAPRWPDGPRSLSSHLGHIESAVKAAVGVEVVHDRTSDGRFIFLKRIDGVFAPPTTESTPDEVHRP